MEISNDININYPVHGSGKVVSELDKKYDAKYYQQKTQAVLNTKWDENTKLIIPDIFSAIEIASNRGEWYCDISADNKIFKLIDKSNVSQFLKERGFDTKYVTICRDDSVYRISWK